jgi:hypothetical protein
MWQSVSLFTDRIWAEERSCLIIMNALYTVPLSYLVGIEFTALFLFKENRCRSQPTLPRSPTFLIMHNLSQTKWICSPPRPARITILILLQIVIIKNREIG